MYPKVWSDDALTIKLYFLKSIFVFLYRNNVAQVSIYFGELNYEEIQDTVAIPVSFYCMYSLIHSLFSIIKTILGIFLEP